MKSILLQLALVVAILVGGVGVFRYLASTRPEPVRQETVPILPRVQIATAEPSTVTLEIRTQGTVASRNQAEIRAEVGGRIIAVTDIFNEGIVVHEGDLLLEIDPADYRAALAAAESALAEAELALALEEAQSEQALLDWQRLNPDREPDPLVVRTPWIAARRAGVTSAAAAVERARRDLDRTRAVAPFDGRIRRRQVSPGDVIPPGGSALLGQIDGTVLEIRLPIAPNQRLLLDDQAVREIDQLPIPVHLNSTQPGDTRSWNAEIERFSGTIDPTNGFTYAIARIAPCDDAPNIGAFLDARIEGRTVQNVFRIPRVAILRDGFVLEARPTDPAQGEESFTLHEIPVELVQSLRDEAIVQIPGRTGPLQFSTTPIRAFSPGMAVHPASPTTEENPGSQNVSSFSLQTEPSE